MARQPLSRLPGHFHATIVDISGRHDSNAESGKRPIIQVRIGKRKKRIFVGMSLSGRKFVNGVLQNRICEKIHRRAEVVYGTIVSGGSTVVGAPVLKGKGTWNLTTVHSD